MKRRIFKKVICLIFVCFAFLLFCSCERYGTEIEDMMIIEGVAIDKENECFLVTVEMLNNKQSASADSSNVGDEMTLVYSGKGETISEALHTIINKTGTIPNYTHNKVIILGESVLKEDISKILDFFERDYTTEPITLLCVAKDLKAEDILKADIGTDISKSETLEKILTESSKSSVTPKVRVIDAINIMLEETSSLILPAVTLEENNKDVKTFFVENSAVFDYQNTLSYFVDKEISKSIVFLLGDMKNGTIVTEDENGKKASFLIVKGKTDYAVTFENNKINYNVNLKLYCDLNEYEGSRFSSISDETVNTFKENISANVKTNTENAFRYLKTYGGYDCIRFGRRLLNENSKLYKSVKPIWQEIFVKTDLFVTVEVVIRRVGEESYHE